MKLATLFPACAALVLCGQAGAAEPFHWGVNGHPVSQEAYELLDEPNFGAGGESDYGLVAVAKDGAGKWQVKRKKPAFDAFNGATGTVLVSAKSVPAPVAVRYAWRNNPTGLTLANSEGLSLAPFRTDGW